MTELSCSAGAQRGRQPPKKQRHTSVSTDRQTIEHYHDSDYGRGPSDYDLNRHLPFSSYHDPPARYYKHPRYHHRDKPDRRDHQEQPDRDSYPDYYQQDRHQIHYYY